jgi:hypothetical protein
MRYQTRVLIDRRFLATHTPFRCYCEMPAYSLRHEVPGDRPGDDGGMNGRSDAAAFVVLPLSPRRSMPVKINSPTRCSIVTSRQLPHHHRLYFQALLLIIYYDSPPTSTFRDSISTPVLHSFDSFLDPTTPPSTTTSTTLTDHQYQPP